MVLRMPRRQKLEHRHWSTIGKVYFDFFGTKLKLQEGSNKHKFTVVRQISLGTVLLRILILHNKIITEKVDVVHGNNPFLVGFVLLNKYGLYVNNVKYMLCCRKFGLKFPFVRNNAHVYFTWENEIKMLHTLPELLKLRFISSHRATNILDKFSKISKALRSQCRYQIKPRGNTKIYDICQRFSHAPSIFKVLLSIL